STGPSNGDRLGTILSHCYDVRSRWRALCFQRWLWSATRWVGGGSENYSAVGGSSFDGTYDQKFFNANGNQVFEDMSTIHATRLSVSQFAEGSNATASR